jgi:hypothetical protein
MKRLLSSPPQSYSEFVDPSTGTQPTGMCVFWARSESVRTHAEFRLGEVCISPNEDAPGPRLHSSSPPLALWEFNTKHAPVFSLGNGVLILPGSLYSCIQSITSFIIISKQHHPVFNPVLFSGMKGKTTTKLYGLGHNAQL